MDIRSTPEEAVGLLSRMFPGGLVSSPLLRALCPDGWRRSALRAAFHPAPEVLYEEYLTMHEALPAVFGQGPRRVLPAPEPPPPFEEFAAGLGAEGFASDEEEAGRLTGLCLWDVFSDNHEVVLADGRTARLGSFRSSAEEIAHFYYRRPASPRAERCDLMEADMDYMEFYMGSRMIARRASLRPVYRLIFARLQEEGCDWHYEFPQPGLTRFDDPAPDGGSEAHMEAEVERTWRASLEAARHRPPPDIVQAYHDVYGRWPYGWPPWEEYLAPA
jgi:hypothetical protein